MKHALAVLMAAFLVAGEAAGVRPAGAESITFHVAIDGDDSHAGSPDAPFASLEQARNAVRDLTRRQGLPPGGARVVIHAGVYARKHTFELSRDDSGTPEAPIAYAAAPNEMPVLSGMAALRPEWFAPVSDRGILDRVIDPAARERMLQGDLRAHGITELGELRWRLPVLQRPPHGERPPPTSPITSSRRCPCGSG